MRHAPGLGHVHHIEGHQHRKTQLHHLRDQKQIPFKVAGINHTENGVRFWECRRIRPAGVSAILVRRPRGKAVHAGQIDQLNGFAGAG
jgi:alpha-galactosidase/6-phospho-beta-glucosidase family protein